MIQKEKIILSSVVLSSVLMLTCLAGISHAQAPILNRLHTISTIGSTVPSNGDVNPYGVALVQRSRGLLRAGHILVSNFNNSANLQGTGTTISDVAPNGTVNLFAQIDAGTLPGACPGGVGLTTALAVLHHGWVIVGSLPTTDGTSATAQAGCLIILDSNGNPVETISGDPINGPWDMTVREGKGHARVFVSNVLNGTVAGGGQIVNQGTVVRIDLKVSEQKMPVVESMTIIGSGFAERTDPDALVIGPTGLGLSSRGNGQEPDNLYVADSLNNQIVEISNPLNRTDSAGTGTVLTSGGSLNDPLGLFVTPQGEILTVNGNDGFITEINSAGSQVATKLLDNTGGPPPGAGTLFGIIFVPHMGVVFVDDGSNTLNLLSH